VRRRCRMDAKRALGPSLYLMPTPLTVVGAQVDGEPTFVTVAWVTLTGPNPALLLASLNKRHYTNRGIRESRSFSVNVPAARQVVEVDYCGLATGAKTDKSEVFTVFYGVLGTAPLAEECPLNFECRLRQVVDLGTHELFVGEIVETYADEVVLDEKGRPSLAKVDPLVFAMPEYKYWRVGEVVAPARKIGWEYEPRSSPRT